MVEPVMSAFEEILESWRRTKCEACGHPTGDPAPVIKVGQLVLDRSGFHPSVTVEQAPKANPYDNLTEDELIERLERTLDVAKQARDERRLHAAPEAIEGFLVPEDDDVRPTPQVDSTMPPDDDHKPLKTKDLPHD
jgi:hypothetical protein